MTRGYLLPVGSGFSDHLIRMAGTSGVHTEGAFRQEHKDTLALDDRLKLCDRSINDFLDVVANI